MLPVMGVTWTVQVNVPCWVGVPPTIVPAALGDTAGCLGAGLLARKAVAKGESAFTPAVALVCGLAAALDYIRRTGDGNLADGREALIHNAETSAAMVRAGVQALGLKLFAPTCPSAAVTAVVPPPGVDAGAIVKEFRERFAMVVANGQSEMKGKLFRIAHLGYYDYLDAVG